jgi:hypothetical protein
LQTCWTLRRGRARISRPLRSGGCVARRRVICSQSFMSYPFIHL